MEPARSRPLTASLGTGAMLVLLDVPPLPPLDLLYGGQATDAIILAALGGGLFFAARHFWKRGTNRALVVLVPLMLFGLAVLGLDCQAWSRGRERRNDERSRYEEEHPRPSARAPGSASGRPPVMPSGSSGSPAR